jgi:threonine/homoserine/homoserine lactone efflux protein
MGLENWTAFIAASAALLLIPGPAILPLFPDPARPCPPQAMVMVMVASFVGLAALNALGCALPAGRLSGAVARRAVRRGCNREGGLLVGAGLATATLRRS